jgi:Holliday junction resolvase
MNSTAKGDALRHPLAKRMPELGTDVIREPTAKKSWKNYFFIDSLLEI